MSHWKNKVVLVTGGSAGLGYQLATTWAALRAHVIVVARDGPRLESAAEQIRNMQHTEVTTYRADVTKQDDVAAMQEWLVREFGHLDVLVNAAGKSDRGLATTTSRHRYESLFAINFLAAVDCTQRFWPQLKQSRGSLVNIGSLASKISAPYLGAYAPSKFALAAYTQQLRLESRGSGVHVLLVCPGPIARHDDGHRYDQSASDLPAGAQRPAGGAHLNAIDPQRLSEQIIKACERRQSELILPRKAQALAILQEISTTWSDWVIRKSTPAK